MGGGGRADAGEPGCRALVHPLVVVTCDLDVAVLRGIYPLAGPYPLGHECIAEVAAVGDTVRSVRGRRSGRGLLSDLLWSMQRLQPGAHGQLRLAPEALELRTRPRLVDDPGAEVLVGGGDGGPNSIGLYAAGLVVVSGASRTTYLDHDRGRLEIAEALGAEPLEAEPPRKAGVIPITVDASGTEAGLRCALNSTAFGGCCTSPSMYLEGPSLPMFWIYSRCCTLHTGQVHARPAIRSVLASVRDGLRSFEGNLRRRFVERRRGGSCRPAAEARARPIVTTIRAMAVDQACAQP